MSRDRLEEFQKVLADIPPDIKQVAEANQPLDLSTVEEEQEQETRKKKDKKKKKGKRRDKKKKKEQGSRGENEQEEQGEENASAPPKDPLQMEEFLKQMDEILINLKRINDNCDGVEMAHQLILNSVAEEEIEEQERVISGLISSTNCISLLVKERLEVMEGETRRLAPEAPAGSGDLRMRQINQAALYAKFSAATSRFRTIQKEAELRQHAQVERQYKIMNPSASTKELEEVTEAVGAMNLTSQQIFYLGQTRDPLDTLERMKARRTAVMEIEKGIYVLHQLVVDLQVMVDEQAQCLDNLENFFEDAIGFTEEARGHMKEAARTQRNIRRLHCNLV